jgi:phosphoglycerate dehydrogenase-like enzyme
MPQESIPLVITTPIDAESLRRIEAVSDRLRIDQVSPWVVAERKGDASQKEKLDRALDEAEILYGWIHHFPKGLRERAPRLKWIQTMSAGVDRLPAEILKSGIRVVNASGLHGTPMGELALAMMLMFVKDAPACQQMKQSKTWKRFVPGLLRGRTVGVLGLGVVGREIARLAKAFGMRVVGMRRSDGERGVPPDVDRLYGRDALTDLLTESDFVVVALPLTEETRGLLGEAALRAMKPTACLINVARGAISDEDALIRVLEEKRIAGAGLDVFVQEPLPPESRFYALPNVIFSPHISGEMPDYEARATDVFCENLRRYLADAPFLHEVDPEKGY